MGARVTGEVALTYNGRSYELVLDFNALADFEAELGGDANALAVLGRPGGLNVREMRLLMWAGLRQHAPEITLSEAGQVLAGNMDKLASALAAAMPGVADDEAGKPVAGGRPRRD